MTPPTTYAAHGPFAGVHHHWEVGQDWAQGYWSTNVFVILTPMLVICGTLQG